MNITKRVSKLIATKVSDLSTNVAYSSTKACITMTIEEPKMPKSLLKKAK